MLKIIFSIIFLFSQLTFAQCPDDIQEINKGQVANCDGLLFSPEASQEALDNKNDLEYYKKVSDKLLKRKDLTDKEIGILDKRLQIYIEQSRILAEEVHKKEKEDKWQKFIYFGLGVFATGIAVYGAAHLR